LEEFALHDPLVSAVFFIVSCFVLGAVVKYIDDAFDEKTFSRKIALILSPLAAIFWAYIMALDSAAFIILTAINVGVIVKGKIDNVAFIIAVLCIYVVYFFIGSVDFLLNPAFYIPLIIISIAGVLDEVANDYSDKVNLYAKGGIYKFFHVFFEYRFIMKITVLLFALAGSFAFTFFLAFLAWDIGYAMVMRYSRDIAHKRKFYYDARTNGY